MPDTTKRSGKQAAKDPDAAALERLGMAASLAGRDADAVDLFTRAHNEHLAHGDAARAARSAFWTAFVLVGAGEPTRASGWIARTKRLIDESGRDCVERGFVLLPHALEQIARGDIAGASEAFAE